MRERHALLRRDRGELCHLERGDPGSQCGNRSNNFRQIVFHPLNSWDSLIQQFRAHRLHLGDQRRKLRADRRHGCRPLLICLVCRNHIGIGLLVGIRCLTVETVERIHNQLLALLLVRARGQALIEFILGHARPVERIRKRAGNLPNLCGLVRRLGQAFDRQRIAKGSKHARADIRPRLQIRLVIG